ncbi:hypothetical protein F0562_012328 [Nyssa sinensis]|uniref:Uncharacterized protein n=1 Tax=Nyssa sinensis TaxID=561372 RepID=A0A5J4ZWB0_9ASTE|nr:hypothetical protein F0562_012328 [Nyssa sinensis]
MDGPKTFHQGSLVFTSQNFSPAEVENFHGERIPEQARGSITPGLTQLHQYVEQNGLTKQNHPKLEGQQNGYVGMRLLAKDPAICSKGSLTSGTLQPGPINLNDFLIEMAVSSETNSVSQKQHSQSYGFNSQISASGKNENLNDSGNHIIFQDLNSDKVNNISICTKSNSAIRDHSDNCCELRSPGLTIHGREAIQSNEVPQFIKDGKEPSPSSTISDSVTKHIDSYSSKEDKSYANSEEPVVTESSKKLKDKSDLDEAYDNIAADILLSFTSDKAHANYKPTGTWVGTVSGRSGKRNSSPDKKWKLRGRKHASYSKYGSVNESVEWTQFVQRGRTSRRPQ